MTKPLGITIHMDDSSKNVKLLAGEVEVSLKDAEECPAHGKWTAKMSRNGKAFWGCVVPDGEPYCCLRPDYRWAKAHPAADAILMASQQVASALEETHPAEQPVQTTPPRSEPTASESFDDLPF